jgi:hypothetical protein
MGFLARLFANVSGGKAIQPDLTARPNLDRVIVHVRWVSESEMPDIHPHMLGFTRGPQLMSDGEWHAWIDAVQPRDFNDFNRLETLGHEFFHALGATHKEA